MKGNGRRNFKLWSVLLLSLSFVAVFALTGCTKNASDSGESNKTTASITAVTTDRDHITTAADVSVTSSSDSSAAQMTTSAEGAMSNSSSDAATDGSTGGSDAGTDATMGATGADSDIMSTLPDAAEMNLRYVASPHCPAPDMTVEDGVFYLYDKSKNMEYAYESQPLYVSGNLKVVYGPIGREQPSGVEAECLAVRFYRDEKLFADMAAVQIPEGAGRNCNLVAAIESHGIFSAVLSINTHHETGTEQEFWRVDLTPDRMIPTYLGRFSTERTGTFVEIGDVAIDKDYNLYVENYGVPFSNSYELFSELLRFNLFQPSEIVNLDKAIVSGYLRNKMDPELAEKVIVIDQSDRFSPEYKAEVYKQFAGTWRLDGEDGLASFEILEDGTFISYYGSGVEEFRGFIELIDDTPKFIVLKPLENGGNGFMYSLQFEQYRGSLRSPLYRMDFERKE